MKAPFLRHTFWHIFIVLPLFHNFIIFHLFLFSLLDFFVLCHSISHTLHVQLFTHRQRGRRKESGGGSTEGGPDGITYNLTRLTWTEEVEFS